MTTAVVSAPTVAHQVLVAIAVATVTMVSAAITTTVVTTCTLGCGRDL